MVRMQIRRHGVSYDHLPESEVLSKRQGARTSQRNDSEAARRPAVRGIPLDQLGDQPDGFKRLRSRTVSHWSSSLEPLRPNGTDVNRSSDDEVLITRLLEKSIRRTEAVDREALCIVAGEKVWQLRLTLHFLADEGNLLDCAAMAAMGALKHFRKPEVEVIGDEVIVVGPLLPCDQTL